MKEPEGRGFWTGVVESSAGWVGSESARLLQAVPGLEMAARTFWAFQRPFLEALKARLDELDHERRARAALQGEEAPLRRLSLFEAFDELLERSVEQTPEEGRKTFFLSMVERLAPDQARILAALSDGDSYPLVHVAHSRGFGGASVRVLENASTVGRAAGVMLPEMVPRYLSHLRALGLVETGDEDESLGDKYQILESDTSVRTAIKDLEAKRLKPQVIRRSLRISELGAALWEACRTVPERDD